MLNELPGAKENRYKPGVVVGSDYILLRSIGRGGMGEVFAAEHKYIAGRICALKILAPHLVTERSWQRFEREARSLGKLDHAGIVKIYTMGVDREICPYYVMELIEGETLSDYLNKHNRFSVEQAISVFMQVASALDCAHRNAIIHRDLKPSNIMLLPTKSDSLSVKLVDFGVAALTANQDHQRLTEVGEAVGTPLYMSPEQFMGEAVGEPADIYSMGCTMFEALTGRPPFRGENALQTIHMHQFKLAPKLIDAYPRGQFSDDLEYMMARMLSKLPANRYQNMTQVMHDFERLTQGKPLIQGRRELSVGDDLPDSHKKVWSFGPVPLVLCGLLCLALLVPLGCWALFGQSKYPTLAPVCTGLTESMQSKSSPSGAKTRTLLSESLSAEMTPEQEESFMALPDFNLKQKNSDGMSCFQFPTHMILGDFNDGYRTIKASGLIKVRKNILPIFSIGEDFPILSIAKLKRDSVGLEIQISSRRRWQQFCKLARGWHTVGSIRLCNFELEQSDVELLDSLPPTKSLIFTSCRFNKVDFSRCKAFSRARILKIDGLPEGRSEQIDYPPGLKSCIEAAGKCPSIRQLDVWCCVWPAGLTAIVCQQPYINVIHFDRAALSAIDLQLLCQKSGLKELIVGDWPFAFSDVLSALPKKNALKVLTLTDPRLPPETAHILKEIPRIEVGVTTPYSDRQIDSIKKLVPAFMLVGRRHLYRGDGQFIDVYED